MTYTIEDIMSLEKNDLLNITLGVNEGKICIKYTDKKETLSNTITSGEELSINSIYDLVSKDIDNVFSNKVPHIHFIRVDGGEIIDKVRICPFVPSKDYMEELQFELSGRTQNFYHDYSGDFEELDAFLKEGSIYDVDDYSDRFNLGDNVYVEYWLTDLAGTVDDAYYGLIIE